MSPTARAAIATVLTLAFGAVPLVADWCAASCGASRASAGATMPACHHADASAARIGHHPSSCGQSHHPIVVDAAATTARLSRTPILVAAVVVDVEVSTVPTGAAGVRACPKAHSSPPPLPLALASALRI